MNQDYLIRAVAAGGNVRAYAARTTGLCDYARRRHDTWPVASAALGRVLTGAALLGAMLGSDETVLLQFMGDGPISPVVGWADATGQVKGYVSQPHVDFPLSATGKLDVGRAVGSNGNLHVIRDLGLKGPYHGTTPLVNGEIGSDLASYLLNSEQIPSAVGLGVLVETDDSVAVAGGFVIQIMPGATEEVVSLVERTSSALNSVTSLLSAGITPEGLLQRLLNGTDYRFMDQLELQFSCGCTRERFAGHLVSLGPQELANLKMEGDDIEVRCHFCNASYHFTPEELEAFIGLGFS